MLCKPKSFYDEKHKVAIGYKNPLCLARAKQAQSVLYSGHALVTTNHAPTVIHDSEDTREIAEITRKRMLKKAETSVPKPISALTVYPPNTPVKLVPRILPTKSQFNTLFKEVKEMEEIFDQMNNEVNKNTIDKQCAEIEKKNLLIENENLIVNLFSTQLLDYLGKITLTGSKAECLKSHTVQEAPDFNSFFKIKNLEHQIQEKDNITRAHTSEKTSTMLNEIESLKAYLRSKESCFTSDYVKPKVLAPGMLSVQCRTGHPLVSGLRLFKTYDGNRSKLKNFVKRQFCDSNLEVAFRKHTCFVRDINGADILNQRILPPPKSENTNMEVLHTLHMDLCGPMRVQSIKGKKYILVIVDDYSRFTWVKFLRSKDETPEFVTNFLKQIQVGLNKTVRFIRTDNGTEFVNQVMSEYYEGVGIFHQKSVPRTPQQNGVVERRNRTLVEAARTMMIFSKAPMFLWAEAVATACYTQNRSLIHTRHNKTPYELVHDKKPDLTFFRVFGALCYPTNDSENLGKFQAKADIGIFVGYAPSRKGKRGGGKKVKGGKGMEGL
ncbi:retrovirus-related pol polyprotein from transposon TNT 1-94 [Tanacetum coccineum]